MRKSVKEGRSVLAWLFFIAFDLLLAWLSLCVLCLGPIRLERALCIDTGAVDVHLTLVSAHCILVQAIEFSGAFPAHFATPASLFEYLRAVAHDFGRLSGDLGLEIILFSFFVGFERALKAQNFVTTLAIVDQELLCGNFSALLDTFLANISGRLERQAVHFLPKLLAASVSEATFSIFSLFEASSIELLSIVSRTLRSSSFSSWRTTVLRV